VRKIIKSSKTLEVVMKLLKISLLILVASIAIQAHTSACSVGAFAGG